MNHINLFLILVIVLVVLLFVLVILLVTFREGIEKQCCGGSRRGSNSSGGATNRRGFGNPAFDDQEIPGTVQQRPFSNMEATESPPSYEEAIKQELFRFRLPPPQRSNSFGDVVAPRDIDRPSTSFADVVDSSSTPVAPDTNTSQPSTSHHPSRSRSSTTSSCLASHLSTIEEENEDSQTVTVVIDCIGVQASRLMDKCDTSVDLADGGQLASHSKC